MGDLRKISSNRDAFKAALVVAYPDKKAGAIPVDAGTTLRANKSETFDWLKFRLEGEGDRTHGNAFTDAAFTGYRI